MKTESLGRFVDQRGGEHEVIVHIAQRSYTPSSTGEKVYVDTTKEYKTSQGIGLNKGPDETFVTLNGEVLTPI